MADETRKTSDEMVLANFDSVPAVQLFEAQVDAARFFEATYLSVAEYPDIARKVRMTAHAARTQHMMSSSLMKSFKISSSHIIDTLIPMILDAVDIQERSIIEAAFTKLVTLAKRMSTEAKETQQRYREIQTQVQDSIADITSKNKEVKDRTIAIQVEAEQNQALLQEQRRAAKQLEVETKLAKENLETLQKNKDDFFQQNVDASKELARETTFLDRSIVPTDEITGIGSVVHAVLGTGLNLLRCFTRHSKRVEQYDRTHKRYQEEQGSYEKAAQTYTEQEERMHQLNKEKAEKWANLRKLCLEKVSLGDATALATANARLGDVDAQLTRLIKFWDSLVLILQYLRDNTEAGEVYLNKIENEKCATRFKASITKAEEKWKIFDLLCQNYIQACDDTSSNRGIDKLYKFLSMPIDSLSADDKLNRMHEMFKMIQDETTGSLE